jgi:hypothetical protein
MHFSNFTDMKRISQDFSDCVLQNDKYTKNQPIENFRVTGASTRKF